MNWIECLFGGLIAQTADMPTRSASVGVVDTVRSHLNRICAGMTDATMQAILGEVEERFFENALEIDGIVQQTQTDRRLQRKELHGTIALAAD